jgi:hypothetical protein
MSGVSSWPASRATQPWLPAFRVYNDTGEDLTVTGVRASVGTAPTGATLIVDVNLAGTTIFTTQASRPAIAISAPRRQ